MQYLVPLASWLLGALYCVSPGKQLAAMLKSPRIGEARSLSVGLSLPDNPQGKGSRVEAEDKLRALAEAYKVQIFSKLSELAAGRVARNRQGRT